MSLQNFSDVVGANSIVDQNIYCDESTHLENDGYPFLVLGAIGCAKERVRETHQEIRNIIVRHGLPESFEIKWSKVSPGKYEFYEELVNYFFQNSDLRFRAVVASKRDLRHKDYGQSHDDWYYKMMYLLLKGIIPQAPASAFIYLDKKDTRGGIKVQKLHDVLKNSLYDFNQERVQRLQIVESHHVGLMQLADLLMGAVNSENRLKMETEEPSIQPSKAKAALVKTISERAGLNLTKSTLLSQEKFNLFQWDGNGVQRRG